MFRYFTRCYLFFALAFMACSSGTSSNPNNPTALITITNSFLKANSTHLTGTLTVYPENSNTPTAQVDLLFAENEDGNLTVSSPIIKLKKTTIFRFVVTFFWDDIPFAYVDTTQATSNESTDEISFTESLIVYSFSSNPDVNASVSDGVLPNLDSDGDGYSNFEELRAGTNPNDGSSVPDGPAIVWNNLSVGKSVDGTIELFITATDKDGVSNVQLLNPSNITDNSSLADTFFGQWDTTALADGDFALKARATDTLGNVSESELIVNISNKVDRSGPQISFKIYQLTDNDEVEIDINNGQSAHDVVRIEITAKDATGVSFLRLSPDSNFNSTIQATREAEPTNIQFKLDTTVISTEKTETLIFEASDIRGQTSEKILILPVKNNPTINNLQINDQTITDNSTLTLSALKVIAIKWDTIFADNIRLEKGESCSLTNQAIFEQSQLAVDSDFNLSSTLGSGKHLFCSYRTGKNISGEGVTFSSNLLMNITWDDDEDSFKNEDDCAPQNKLAFPGNTRAYLMDDDYNCDGDNININLTDATYSFLGASINDKAGYNVTYAGDINGDTCSDILISTTGESQRDSKSRIYLIYGRGINCEHTDTSVNLQLKDIEIEPADDTEDPKYFGAVFRSEQIDDEAGAALQGTGDINNDGCDDFLIGAPKHDANGLSEAGRVYLIYGKGSGCSTFEYSGGPYRLDNIGNEYTIKGVKFTGSNNGDQLGTSVAGLGDVNGDERLDFGFSAPEYDAQGIAAPSNVGAVYVVTNELTENSYSLPLQLTETGVSFKGYLGSEKFGKQINYAGRFNHDRFDDIAVESNRSFFEGKLSIIPGSSRLTYTSTASFDYLTRGGIVSYFPSSFSPANDIDRDGYDDIFFGFKDDLIITQPIEQPLMNIIYGRLDTDTTISLSLSSVLMLLSEPTGPSDTDGGPSVSSGADINTLTNPNKLSDFIVGADWSNDEAGKVYIQDLNDGTGDKIFKLSGEYPGDRAGKKVSLYGGIKFDDDLNPDTTSPIPGDFNGDGCADPLIGAPNYGSDDNGKVYLMLSGYCE